VCCVGQGIVKIVCDDDSLRLPEPAASSGAAASIPHADAPGARDPGEGLLDWAAIDLLGRRLAEGLVSLAGDGHFDRVIGVSRGGLIPATLVACHLGVKRLETVQVRLYEGSIKLEDPLILGRVPTREGPGGDASRTLIVDEMVDSGTTLRHLATLFPEATFAVLVARAPATPLPCAHGLRRWPLDSLGGERHVWVARTLPTEHWVLFPWSPEEDRAGGVEAP